MNDTTVNPFANWDASVYKPAKKAVAVETTNEDTLEQEVPQVTTETTQTVPSESDPVVEPAASTDDTTKEELLDDEEATYKKRYADLRSHLNDKASEIKELKTKVKDLEKKPDITKLATDEDLAEFEKESPDVYAVLKAIALKTNSDLKEQLEELKSEHTKAAQDKAFSEILKAHPDADTIRKSPEFATWYNAQTRAIQGLLSSETPIDAIRGLDMYKAELGKTTEAPAKDGKKAAKAGAAQAVTATAVSKAAPADTRKIWSEKEVAKMSAQAYARAKADIKLAMQQGRFNYDLQ